MYNCGWLFDDVGTPQWVYLIPAIALWLTLADQMKFLWIPGLASLALVIAWVIDVILECPCLEVPGVTWALIFAGPYLMLRGAAKAKA